MNSLKNTIVAVGLLGLSFAFYQFSEKKPTLKNELVSPVGQSEVADEEPSRSPMDSTLADAGPAAKQPALTVKLPENPFPRVAVNSNNDANEFSAPDFKAPKLQPTAPQIQPRSEANPLTLQPRATPKTAPLQPAQPSAGPPEANAFSAGLAGKSPEQRDRGLIDALKDNQVNSNGFEAMSNPARDRFVQSPVGDDNSFNQKANGIVNAIGKPSTAFSGDSTPDATVHERANYDHLKFQEAWPVVEELVSREQYKDALKLLTRFYQQDSLTGPQQQRLEGWLDALAGKAIFSMEHHLHDAYVTRGETLAQLAEAWKVPAELIYNVNQSVINNPQQIPAGTELKMIRGPFHAEINAKERVMTLFVDEMYAVRFGVRIGISGSPRPGRFGVMMKSAEGMNWIDADENVYPPSSPLNGYGPHFLGLEGELCVHAVGEDKKDGHYGCFGLLAKDAKDVFEILTTDSKVTVK